jgi:hypothetical protein
LHPKAGEERRYADDGLEVSASIADDKEHRKLEEKWQIGSGRWWRRRFGLGNGGWRLVIGSALGKFCAKLKTRALLRRGIHEKMVI